MNITKDLQLGVLCSLLKDIEFFKTASQTLKLSDFDMPQIRLIFEIALKYLKDFDNIIPSDILWQEILANQDELNPKYKTMMSSEDSYLKYLVEVYQKCHEAINHPSTDQTEYYRKLLPDYIAEIRMGQINDRMDLSAQEKAAEIARMKEETALLGAQKTKLGSILDLKFSSGKEEDRVGTGIIGLDRITNWGLKPGEIALLAAASGTGKSTGMLNFAISNALKGIRSLIITLENPLQMYLERMVSIFGHFSPYLFKLGGPENWPKDAAERLEYVSTRFDPVKCIKFDDKSTTTASCMDIEKAIVDWKQQVKEEIGSDESCKVVYVDYLNVISPRGLYGLGPKPSKVDILPEVAKQLGIIARKHKVVLWTAQQCVKSALKKEIIDIDDIAFASHVVDWLDLGIGLAKVRANDFDGDNGFEDEEAEAEEEGEGKDMLIHVWKSRDSDAQGKTIPIYRGPTLRMWSNVTYAQKVDEMAKSMNMDGLFKMMTPKSRNGH